MSYPLNRSSSLRSGGAARKRCDIDSLAGSLIRLGAVSATGAGALLVVNHIVDPLVGSPLPQESPVGMLLALAFTAHLPMLALGLVGLHLRQAPEAGAFGLVGLAGALVGVLAMAGLLWNAWFVDPVLREQAPALLESEPALTAAGGLVSLLLYAVGLLLFALATLRAGVLPRPAAALLAVGLVAAVPLEGVVPGVLLIYPAALCWLGVAALRPDRRTRQPSPAAQPTTV